MRHCAMQCSLVFLLALVSCASAGEVSRENFYRGQVRDQDTGIPLAGVLVVFYWQREVYSPKGITSEFHWATEVLTDGNGRFEVSRAPEKMQDASIYHIGGPAIIFFDPRYRQYRIEVDGVHRYRDPTRIYMQRVTNPRDALNLGLQPGFPNHHTPLLLKAINEVRARLGLATIQPPEKGKRDE